MLNTQKFVKVVMAWTSIVYVVCYAGVAMVPGIRPGFIMYGLHTNTYRMMNQFGWENVFSFGTFVSGLVIWNVIALLGAWLFVALWNKMK